MNDGKRRKFNRNEQRVQRGAAAIEFAVVFVMFFMLLYGAIAYGIVFAIKHSFTQAAAEGTRAALQDVGDVSQRKTLAQDTAAEVISWLGDRAPVPVVSSGPCATTPYICVTVTLTYDYAANPIIPGLPGLGIVLPDVVTSQATVQLDGVAGP